MKKLSDIQIDEIIEKYLTNMFSCNDLAKIYNVSTSCIHNTLKREKAIVCKSITSKRKYTLDEHYFDVIDTEEKAYFLGLLYADGYNYETQNSIHLSLQIIDKNILEKFNIAINSNRPLLEMNHNKKYYPNSETMFRCLINSKIISEQLVKLGCPQKKSLILKFPTEEQVPSYLIRHFIRGYFDGDGCFSVGIQKRQRKNYVYHGIKYHISILSTLNFCISLQNIIKEQCSINLYIYTNKRCTNGITKTLQISGNNQIMTFLDWIYEDSKIYLDRKYNKYIKQKDVHGPK